MACREVYDRNGFVEVEGKPMMRWRALVAAFAVPAHGSPRCSEFGDRRDKLRAPVLERKTEFQRCVAANAVAGTISVWRGVRSSQSRSPSNRHADKPFLLL